MSYSASVIIFFFFKGHLPLVKKKSVGLWLICFWWQTWCLFMGRPFPLGLRLRIQVPCWFLSPSSHSQDMVLHIDLANQGPEGTLGRGWGWGYDSLKRRQALVLAPSTIEMWNPQNFTPKVSCPPKCCPTAGQGMSEPCAVIGYLFPFSPHERQSATSVNSLQTAMISRLPEHNCHDPFRIPLSSYYLIPHGVILQLYDILGQLPLQSLLLAVIIFNLLETTHFSTGWQKKASRGGGRGKKKRETGLWIHSAGKIKMLVLKICLALLFLFW